MFFSVVVGVPTRCTYENVRGSRVPVFTTMFLGRERRRFLQARERFRRSSRDDARKRIRKNDARTIKRPG